MAVIKHIASKNADYGESERYLIFQHNEYTQKPILDDEGHMILRDEYYLDGLNCDPFTFASECQELNSYYHKNKNFNEIKSHHYIISFDPKDREECGLTGERAQQLGLTFAKKNFPGHQALVCTHTDGHNESGNIHVVIDLADGQLTGQTRNVQCIGICHVSLPLFIDSQVFCATPGISPEAMQGCAWPAHESAGA